MVRKSFHRSRYQRYTGGPDPLAPPVDLREALESIDFATHSAIDACGKTH